MTGSRFLHNFTSVRAGLRGVALLRCGLALIVAIYLILHIGLRYEIWGANGVYDLTTFLQGPSGPLSIFRFASTPMAFDAVYFGTIATALLYAAGFATRLTSWIFALLVSSFVARNPYATDAGQTVVVLLAFLLCFTDSSKYFAIRPQSSNSNSVIMTMVHNCARFLIFWQMCMIYLWAAFYKLEGATWIGGTAMFYVMRLEECQTFPALLLTLSSNTVFVAMLTYATVFFQMAFPFLIWNEKVKPYIVAIGIALHIGIAAMMGLILFSMTMIVADLSLLSDAQLEALSDVFDRCKMHIVQTIQGKSAHVG